MTKLIIFDLDGTLLNTINDLATATNYALTENGFPTHPVEAYNFFVGNGIHKLMERALPQEARSEEQILRIKAAFLLFYEAHKRDLTEPYKGIPELLLELQAKGIKLAVASNKYHLATQKLVTSYFPNIHFEAVLGQRENIAIKPDPTIIEEIVTVCNVEKKEVLFVGDSGVDMLTAQNAGVNSVGVTWGFRLEKELKAFSPTHIVTNPDEIRQLVASSFHWNEQKKAKTSN